jgi:hypothetical protein
MKMIVPPLVAGSVAAWAAIHPTGPIVTPIAMWTMDPCWIVGDMDENPKHYSRADNARLARAEKLMEKKFATEAECKRAAAKIPSMNYGPGITNRGISTRRQWFGVCDCSEVSESR